MRESLSLERREQRGRPRDRVRCRLSHCDASLRRACSTAGMRPVVIFAFEKVTFPAAAATALLAMLYAEHV